MKQPSVQYATTDDGIRIAYLESGEGRPLVQFPNFFNHALLHWRWSVMAQSTTALAKRFRLVQFDSRGQGLSGRRLGDNHVLDDYIRDVEAIVNQLGLRHFSIYSRTHFAHVAARYAIKHPALVDALVFEDSRTKLDRAPLTQLEDLASKNWDVFLRVAATSFYPGADTSEAVDFLRDSSSQQDWLHLLRAFRNSDLEGVLPLIQVPALVLHVTGRPWFQLEETQRFAALLPKCVLRVLDPGERAQVPEMIEEFLAEALNAKEVRRHDLDPGRLSTRERMVLRLIAQGRTNREIAADLHIQVNTVQRHVSNIFAKAGLANRADAAAYATRLGLA